MQKYKYVAVDIEKKKYKSTFLAENIEELRIQLQRQNLYLIKATPLSEKPPSAFFSLSGRVKTAELTSFCRQFAVMINSGVSIVYGLEILKEQPFSCFFKKVISIVYEDVKVGVLLSDAMKKHPKVFPNFLTGMIGVGEQSGTLGEVLISCANYYEGDAKLKAKTKSAMVYPSFLLLMTLAIIVLMIAFVIPAFEDALLKMEAELPPLMQAVSDISVWCISNWAYIFLVLVFICFIFALIGKKEKGKYFYHTVLLYLPFVRKVQISLIASRFARGFGLLLSGGMDIVDAMKVISGVLGNVNIEKRFNKALIAVSEGRSLTQSLQNQNIFPPMLLQMISVGEKTGSLDSVLLHSSQYFDEQADRSLNEMTSLIQPILLVIMGLIVGTLFYAVYSPMLEIMQTL